VIAPTVVILAAGQGTRMRSGTPKVLHDLCGRPMIAWPIAAALAAGARKVVVVDGPQRALEGHLPDGFPTHRTRETCSGVHAQPGALLALELQDFDARAIIAALRAFDVDVRVDALAIAAFDHGAAPPGYSDRRHAEPRQDAASPRSYGRAPVRFANCPLR